MRRHNILLFLIVIVFFTSISCLKQKATEEEMPIARALEKKLYLKDILDAIPANISKEDSAGLVRSLIDKWVRKQLMLNKAELYLTEEQKDVQKKLEDYRTSLLIYRYEQKLLEQELDTVIGYDEIQQYYEENGSNFILGYDLVKALLIKLPVHSTEIYNIHSLYRSDMEADEMQNLCAQYSAFYENYGNDWVILGNILKDVPYDVSNYETFLKYRRSIETRDTNYYYFFHVKDYRLRSTVAPIELVDENIRAILINKRKAQFIKRLETHVYEDAKNRGFFDIY